MKTNHFIDQIATVAGTRKMMALRFECGTNGIFNVTEAKSYRSYIDLELDRNFTVISLNHTSDPLVSSLPEFVENRLNLYFC